MKKELRNSLCLILTALVWGVAFVAQRQGGAAAGPYTFNCIRSFLGAAVLLPVIRLMEGRTEDRKPKTLQDKRRLWIGGSLCGAVLFVASTFQQMGMYYGATAGKAGFLTACYILLVPVLGLFLGKKCGWNVWVSILVAVVGLYFLCLTEGFTFYMSDVLLLLCAVCFSVHIMVIDRFSPLVDGVRMSCIQFMVCGVLGLVPMIGVEVLPVPGGIQGWAQMFMTWDVWIPILYAGIMSCGVAYTLQIVGQKGMNPTVASLILSLESCISVLAGWLILGQKLSVRELSGCLIMFGAIILAQLPGKQEKSSTDL